jgi:hypothetical protein
VIVMGKAEAALSADLLRSLIHYDPETGIFTPRVRRHGWSQHKPLGTVREDGYRYIGVNYGHYRAARLAYLYMVGEWPPVVVDHIDLDRANDRWKNLRPATHPQNQANVGRRANNTSGRKGVTWEKQTRKWRAAIRAGGRRETLGRFASLEAAAAAYADAARRHFGEFAREG